MSTNNDQGQSDLSSPLFRDRTDKDVSFRAGLVPGAEAFEPNTFVVPATSILIWSITIQSLENLNWRINLWNGPLGANADLDLDQYVGSISFDTGQSFRIAGAGQFYYDPHGTLSSIGSPDFVSYPYPIPYKTTNNAMHISLQNNNAGGGANKTAGDAGNVIVEVIYQIVGR